MILTTVDVHSRATSFRCCDPMLLVDVPGTTTPHRNFDDGLRRLPELMRKELWSTVVGLPMRCCWCVVAGIDVSVCDRFARCLGVIALSPA